MPIRHPWTSCLCAPSNRRLIPKCGLLHSQASGIVSRGFPDRVTLHANRACSPLHVIHVNIYNVAASYKESEFDGQMHEINEQAPP